MNHTIPVTLTNLCMVCDGEMVLVQNRIKSDWPGITFPGGHVEHGESFCESVIREVKEETGLTVQSPVLCGIKEWENTDGSRYIVLLYRADRFSGTLRDCTEGKNFWIRRDDLAKQKLSLDRLPLLSVCEDPAYSEFFYRQINNCWEIEIC